MSNSLLEKARHLAHAVAFEATGLGCCEGCAVKAELFESPTGERPRYTVPQILDVLSMSVTAEDVLRFCSLVQARKAEADAIRREQEEECASWDDDEA